MKYNEISLYDILTMVVSALITIFIFYVIYTYKINLGQIHEINSVFQSVITSVSIIIGFSSSFYGILVSLKDSYIIKQIKKDKNQRSQFQNGLLLSAIFSFISLIISILLLVLIYYNNVYIKVLFSGWLFSTISLFGFLFKTIVMCLLIVTGYEPSKIEKNSEL